MQKRSFETSKAFAAGWSGILGKVGRGDDNDNDVDSDDGGDSDDDDNNFDGDGGGDDDKTSKKDEVEYLAKVGRVDGNKN